MNITIQKITPYLWYDHQARAAADYYCSLFDNAKVHSDNGMVVSFELEGMHFLALNGGPLYTFNEAVSFLVSCENQEEVDRLWNGLVADGGSEGRCGWCKDKYGLSWQIVPARFTQMMETGTPEQTRRVLEAMMSMSKMEIHIFEEAFAGQ